MSRATRIFLDLDGVVCDLVGAAVRRFVAAGKLSSDFVWPAGVWDFSQALGIPAPELWGCLGDHEFWADEILPTDHAATLVQAAVDAVGRDRVRFLSRPTLSPYSASGKVAWIRKHFPAMSRQYSLTVDKTDINPRGDVLVDDSEPNIQEWEAAGGIGILWPTPQNRRYAEDPAAAIRELRDVYTTPPRFSSVLTVCSDGTVVLRDGAGGAVHLTGGNVDLLI